MELDLRTEEPKDHRIVEELTREAFWNQFVPGCDEHYLVHVLRGHPDCIPELNVVALCQNKIVGHIMYTRSKVIDDRGNNIDTLTFGPISVLPAYQRQGIGSRLIQHTKKIAIKNKEKAIIIEGHPHNYCKHGFHSCKDYQITDSSGRYPYGLLVLELKKGIFKEGPWHYQLSPAYSVEPNDVAEFDKQFPKKKREYQYSQDEFSIAVRAYLD